ncbi:MAG: endonuclease [Thermoplasmatales archaeon]|nr:MAG: endonuclease [Thermoplasmatales archaeon]
MPITPSKIYRFLLDYFGTQNWWPVDEEYHKKNKSDPRFEIMMGAILTQNTAWSNVEKALVNLKKSNSLTVRKIEENDIENLKRMIQPTGFFNQKATRLKILAAHLHETYKGDLDKFFNRDLKEIRRELLSLKGIGPETADSMLLYAGNHPIFVVDAYTKRICKRLPVKIGESYDDIQQYFEEHLQQSFPEKDFAPLYKELHALIVQLAKKCCKNKPECKKCPLKNHCEFNLSKSNTLTD